MAWHTDEGSYGHYIAVKSESGKTVARVPWGEGDGSRANLIAAAPELLAVAQSIIDEEADGLDRSEWRLKAARAAIAKAEGK